MGIEAVIFLLLAVIACMAMELSRAIREKRQAVAKYEANANLISHARTELQTADKRNAELEAEILRLRKIPLTQSKEKTDNSTIRAKSPAQVRALTEEAFGKQPEIGAIDG